MVPLYRTITRLQRRTHQKFGLIFPIEIIYSGNVRGPIAVLKELWKNQIFQQEKTAYEHVTDLQKRLEATCNTRRDELTKSQEIMKTYFDHSARDRRLKPGDKALLLVPTQKTIYYK